MANCLFDTTETTFDRTSVTWDCTAQTGTITDGAQAGDTFDSAATLHIDITEAIEAGDTQTLRARFATLLLEGAVLADAIGAAFVARPSVDEGAEAGDVFLGSFVRGVTTQAEERTCAVAARPGAVTPGARANTRVVGSDNRTVTA